jgi:hypothetical protein
MHEHSADSNSKKNFDLNTQENTEEMTLSLENLNLNLMKSQSEELSHKDMLNFHDIGIKLFPGAFRYNKKQSYEQNNVNLGDNKNNSFGEENKVNSENCMTKYNLECNNYLCKTNVSNCKKEQKNGLALAFDYYSSFLEDKIK